MSHLTLAFLGAPEVRHGGRAVTFRTRKVLGLLIYLATAGGMHSREKLTALFWPESDEHQGRASLRNTLVYLRNALTETADRPHCIVGRDALGFDFASDVDLDLHILETAFTLARAPAPAHSPEGDGRRHLLAHLQRAAPLCRGSFLEGFSLEDAPDFDDWVRLQRALWHRRMSTIYDRLSQLQSDGGELVGAIETTTRWVAHDSFNETAHRRLMQLHFAVGDRTAALHAYETCRATLAEQLHISPAPETQALAEHLRTLALPRSTPETARPVSPSSALPEVPLVGRANEYVKLIEVYHAVQGGQAQVVILKGEAGIGKTRLASTLVGWAAAQGADLLQGRAFETGGRLPYQPVVEALRSRIERENAPDDLLSDIWLAELSRILPELRDRYPDLPVAAGDEPTARIRLFEAITRLLQVLAERAPLALFLDDLQWADAASLDVLHYAGRRWTETNTPILVLLCLRTEALLTTNALTTWLSGLEHDLRAISLTLGSLTFEDIMQLVLELVQEERRADYQRHPMSRNVEDFGRWLFAETRGQPFYITETLKALLERKLLAIHPVEGPLAGVPRGWALEFDTAVLHEARLRGLLPPGVREVIRTRLAQLTPTAVALLAAGAVLDHGFLFERLCQVAGLGEREALPALDEVLTSRVWRSATEEERLLSRSSGETYFFTHDKIRDVVYTEAGETRRRIFHQRAFEVLQAAGAPPADLAHQALAAGLTEPAFRFSVAAGDEALRLFAVRDAIAHYEQARRVLTEQQGRGTLTASAVEHLSLQLGRAYELNGEFEQARTLYEAMHAFAQRSGTPAMESAALNRLAMLAAQNRFDVERATSLLHQALRVAERSRGSGDEAGLAEAEWNLAQLGFYRMDPTIVLAHGERGLLAARNLGVPELIARSLNVLAYGKMMSGCWEETEVLAEEALGLYRVLGNRAMEADCLCQAATAHINCGRPQAGISAARTAHMMSQEIENTWGQVNSAAPLAQGLLEMGAYTEALAVASRGVNLARAPGMFTVLALSLPVLGAVLRTMLALDAAHTVHREALAMYESLGLQPLTEMIARELCADGALVGAWEEAHAYALQALAARSGVFILSTKLTLWCETEALVRAGEIGRATEDVRHFGERIGTSRRYRIPHLRALAVLAESRGELDEALKNLQEAARLAEEIGLPGELWSIQAARGELHQHQGDESQASQAFACAAQVVESLADKMTNEQQRVTFLSAPQVQHLFQRTTQN